MLDNAIIIIYCSSLLSYIVYIRSSIYVTDRILGILNDSRVRSGKNNARPSPARHIYTKSRACYVVLCMTIILIMFVIYFDNDSILSIEPDSCQPQQY